MELVYVANGNVVINEGSISDNTADNFGGAMYVSGGNIDINHGILNNNEAIFGGAVYLSGNIDTHLTFESGQMNGNKASDDGGAIYATNGNLYIGLLDCTLEDSIHAANRYHPQIQNNKAADCGGGISIANEGAVRFYCGEAVNNLALYKGVGMNVFMDGGKFYLYDGANIGVPRDPDLVIIGGELHNECTDTKYIYLYYYSSTSNDSTESQFQGLAELDEYMNLPDGEYFWDAPDGYRFFGWTPYGENSGAGSEYVRTKNDYKPSGMSVLVTDTENQGGSQNTFDGVEDEVMHLYALWAPETSKITYIDGVTYDEIDSYTINSYNILEEKRTINVGAAPALVNNIGYKLVGWYLFQDENQNANWGIDAKYLTKSTKQFTNMDFDRMYYIPLDNANDTLKLDVESMTFGDITLVADYDIEYTYLDLSKSGIDSVIDSNQSFVYTITCNVSDMSITNRIDSIKNKKLLDKISKLSNIKIKVAFDENSTTKIKGLPLGVYKVEECTDWSWRYNKQPILSTTVASNGGNKTVISTRLKPKWIDYLSYNKWYIPYTKR